MLGLALGALGSLALAVLQNSFPFLLLAIAFDLALAGYITLMLQVRASRVRTAPVVPLLRVEPAEDAQHHTVRVVAG